MIQSVSSVKATPIRKNTNFGQDKGPLLGPAGRYEERRPSKSAAVAKYIGSQFVTGAIVSSVFDGVINLFNVVRKRPENIRSIPVIGSNALMMGVAFAVIGAVFAGIDMARSKK